MKFLALLLSALLPLAAALAEDPASFDVGGLKFTRPGDWKWVPVSSPMRKAQLQVPGAEGGLPADITFFHFGSGPMGGDVQANVQRWFMQFQGPEDARKVETQDIGGTKITLASTEGTFNSGMPGGPTTPLANQALLGAIVAGPEGNVFVKMTGPAALVKGARGKFLEFITAAIKAKP